jgi:hypothetical protein
LNSWSGGFLVGEPEIFTGWVEAVSCKRVYGRFEITHIIMKSQFMESEGPVEVADEIPQVGCDLDCSACKMCFR